MAPVNSGLIKYSDLKNGSINLYDIFILQELLNYKSDYETIVDDIIEREHG